MYVRRFNATVNGEVVVNVAIARDPARGLSRRHNPQPTTFLQNPVQSRASFLVTANKFVMAGLAGVE
jgi:hypothetical protein